MTASTSPSLEEVIERQRREAALQRESLGPLVEAVGALRATTGLVRCLLDELDMQVAVHLELLDVVVRTAHGNRWWESLSNEGGQQ